jgi:hypothetical protein
MNGHRAQTGQQLVTHAADERPLREHGDGPLDLTQLVVGDVGRGGSGKMGPDAEKIGFGLR